MAVQEDPTRVAYDSRWRALSMRHGFTRIKSDRTVRRPAELEPHGSYGTASRSQVVPRENWPSPGIGSDEIRSAEHLSEKKEKHPNLYGILKSSTEDEIIHRVDQDRLKTTYQVDYGEKGDATMQKRIESDIDSEKYKKNGRPSARAELIKKRSQRDEKSKAKTLKKKGEEETQETRPPPWRSEYQDSISKLGSAIMNLRIHQRKAPAPTWAMVVK
ncbi:uncharacterized protein LOC116428033 isoform X2 [Nomia melanderi]|uniref:uncharacterized protein LOC116428033 isoform X2 n=1 Tax=Nomia melanderi TaxID=2448451 RepID=UPI003FCD0715